MWEVERGHRSRTGRRPISGQCKKFAGLLQRFAYRAKSVVETSASAPGSARLATVQSLQCIIAVTWFDLVLVPFAEGRPCDIG